MLSSELAELAGVTVRTLRHYHQIGLLPEPPRSTGGYRRYNVSDLVRLLRINADSNIELYSTLERFLARHLGGRSSTTA